MNPKKVEKERTLMQIRRQIRNKRLNRIIHTKILPSSNLQCLYQKRQHIMLIHIRLQNEQKSPN